LSAHYGGARRDGARLILGNLDHERCTSVAREVDERRMSVA
jgi:hypothetical protein